MSVGTTVVAEPRDHIVQFYERDEQLVETVGAYLAAAVRAGDPALVVATDQHRRAFEAWLTADGIDLAQATASGSLVTLGAAHTLGRLMVDGRPDPAAFDAVIGALVRDLGSNGGTVRAYGEMVALLWDAGQVPAAIELETHWNTLGGDVDFSLFCAYRAQPAGDHAADLDHVCRLHSAVAGEATSAFDNGPEAARAARHFVTETLRQWRQAADVVDDAAVIVTELLTNALVHARSATTVTVAARLGAVRIAVRDASPRLPVAREHGAAAASGRGMALVDAMTNRWGVEPAPDGKVVWAELGVTAP